MYKMALDIEKSQAEVAASSFTQLPPDDGLRDGKQTLRHRIRELVWDSWDQSPEERKLISKIDFFILYVDQ